MKNFLAICKILEILCGPSELLHRVSLLTNGQGFVKQFEDSVWVTGVSHTILVVTCPPSTSSVYLDAQFGLHATPPLHTS